MSKLRATAILFCALFIFSACSDNTPTPAATPGPINQNDPGICSIIAGSEQQSILDQVVIPWCKQQNYNCQYTLKGSVDQAVLLQSGNVPYDAMWFASTV